MRSYRPPPRPTALVLLSVAIAAYCLCDTSYAFQIGKISGRAAPYLLPHLQRSHIRQKVLVGAAAKNSNDEDVDDDPDAWDSPEDYEDFGMDATSESKDSQQDGFSTPNLGIDIGSQLNPLTEAEAAELRAEGAQAIEDAFASRLGEIEDLKASVRKDFERSREALSYASDLRAKEETDKLMSKIDKLSGDFLASNEELRMGTKAAADADQRMGAKGVGLEVGSWGVDSFGRVVVTSSISAAGGMGLLGGFGAGLEKAAREADAAAGAEEDGSAKVATVVENKVLLLSDDGQVRALVCTCHVLMKIYIYYAAHYSLLLLSTTGRIGQKDSRPLCVSP